jgi:HD-GYP domain-containing protein (c-di-GMP phosphodiesterase class II)
MDQKGGIKMRNVKSKLFLQICLFFAIAIALLASYAFSDSLLLNSIFTPAVGLYTAFSIVYGKKSFAPVLLSYFSVVLFARMLFLDEIIFVSIGISMFYVVSVFIEILIFKYLLNRRTNNNQRVNREMDLKDLPYYLLVTLIVAAVGALLRTSVNMIFFSGDHFISFYQTFAGLLFGMWVFNGAVIFGFYNDVKIQTLKYPGLFNVIYMLVFFGFALYIFSNPESIYLLKSFGFIFIFLYIIVGLTSSYHMLVFNNLVFVFLYSIYIAIPVNNLTFTDVVFSVNLFLVIANLSPIIIKQIFNAYTKKSRMLEKNLEVIKKIVLTTEKHFSNTQHVSIDPDMFFRKFLYDMFELGSTILPKVEMGSCYIITESNLEFINTFGYDIEMLNELKIKSSTTHKTLFEPTIIVNADDRNTVDNVERYPDYVEKYGSLLQSIRFNLVFKGDIIGGMSFDIVKGSNDRFKEEDLETYRSFYKLLEGNLGMGDLLYKNNKMINSIIISFVRTVGVYDEYTRVHSEEVANLSRNISNILNLDSETIDLTYYSSVVHDIGKISINPDILNKKGKLTKDEYQIVKGHSAHGYNILSQIDGLKDIAKYIRHHHERWDGHGYPDNLKGEEIPFVSQIIGVCDAVSAMMNKRVYSAAKSIDEIIYELKEQRGKQFSPITCDAMITYLNTKLA